MKHSQPQGFYSDPWGGPGQQRWWDGSSWGAQTQAQFPSQPSPLAQPSLPNQPGVPPGQASLPWGPAVPGQQSLYEPPLVMRPVGWGSEQAKPQVRPTTIVLFVILLFLLCAPIVGGFVSALSEHRSHAGATAPKTAPAPSTPGIRFVDSGPTQTEMFMLPAGSYRMTMTFTSPTEVAGTGLCEWEPVLVTAAGEPVLWLGTLDENSDGSVDFQVDAAGEHWLDMVGTTLGCQWDISIAPIGVAAA